MLTKQIAKYGVVGLISTSIHFVVASLFALLVSSSSILANIFGFSFAFTWSFYANSKMVFQSNIKFSTGIKFFFIQVSILVITIMITEQLENISIFVKIFIVSLLFPACAFVVHKLWTFTDVASK